MSEKSPSHSGKYQPGQCWAFQNGLPEFQSVLFVWKADEEEGSLEIVVEATEAARVDLNVFGLIFRVTHEVLDRSVTRQIEETGPAPSWLPGPEAEEAPSEALHRWETFSDETVEKLIEADLPWVKSLTRAVEKGDEDRVTRILAGNPMAAREMESFYETTPLFFAIQQGNKPIVEMLIRFEAEVNAPEDGMTALHVAARRGHRDIAELLLQHGAALEARDQEGNTPLCLAALLEDQATTRLLEERGAIVDLTCLIRLGRLAVARALLEKNPRACQEAFLPQALAPDLMDRLLKEPEEDRSAVSPGYLAVLRLLLDQGVDPNLGFPLEKAVRVQEALDLANLLLERGANPNQGVEYGSYLLPTTVCGQAMRALLKKHGAKSAEDPDVVLPQCTETLRDNPDDVDALSKRAWAWKQIGQYGRALADAEKILQLDEMNERALSVQAWIYSSCPDENYRNGEKALEIADALMTTYLVGISWEDDGSDESWSITEHEEIHAAALAEQGEFDQALSVLEEIDLDKTGWENRERIARMKELFEAEQPYREDPPSAELEELGRRLAELEQVGGEAVVIEEEGSEKEEEVEKDFYISPTGEVEIQKEDFGVEGIRRLLGEPGILGITSLSICNSNLGDAEALLLAEGLHAPRLTRLAFERNAIRDSAGAVLFAQTRWPELTDINLNDNKLGRRTAQALSGNPSMSRLVNLNFWGNRIRVLGARGLAESPYLTSLEKLNLYSNIIRDEGVCLLAGSPNFPRLTSLELSSNGLTARAVRALANSPYLRQLAELDLSYNRLGDDSLAALAASPFLIRLTSLELHENNFGPEGAKCLAASPILTNVIRLSIQENPIGQEGMKALANSPFLTNLENLTARDCKLDDSAAMALAESSTLTHLKEVYLSKSEIGKAGRKALRKRWEDNCYFW